MNDIFLLLNIYSPAIQSITTVIMVIVTLYFAYLTHKTVTAMSMQRDDSMLPVVIIEDLDIHPTAKKQESYCIGVKIKNIGNGPALGIMVEFYDKETDEFIARSSHFIDYLEKDKSDDTTIHVHKKDLDSVKYRQNEDGDMESSIICIITFHNFYSDENFVKQRFVLNKNTGRVHFVRGSFRFIPYSKPGILQRIQDWIRR